MHNEGSAAGQPALQLIGSLLFSFFFFFGKPLSKFTENLPFRSIHLTNPPPRSPSLARPLPHTPRRLLAHFFPAQRFGKVGSYRKSFLLLFDAWKVVIINIIISIFFSPTQARLVGCELTRLATGRRCQILISGLKQTK